MSWLSRLLGFVGIDAQPKTVFTPSTEKIAVHIGLTDYPGVRNDLRGCLNDCLDWAAKLNQQYGFTTSSLLNQQATKSKVTSTLKEAVVNLSADGHLVVQYSGHGTHVPDRNHEEANGRDEAWVLYDGFLIDDELKDILDLAQPGARITIISDSCHSGTMTRSFIDMLYAVGNPEIDIPKPKFLPPEDDMEAVVLASLPTKKKLFQPRSQKRDILLAACSEIQLAFDAAFNGKPNGAFTRYALQILDETPNITYREFHAKISKELPNRNFPQTPQLEGDPATMDSPIFL